jgi:formylglycine-generating enzyme required for sulfatase activity
MALQVRCPNPSCGAILDASIEQLGHVQYCPHCGQQLTPPPPEDGSCRSLPCTGSSRSSIRAADDAVTEQPGQSHVPVVPAPLERRRRWTKQDLILATVSVIAVMLLIVVTGTTIVMLQVTRSLRHAAADRGNEAIVQQEEAKAPGSAREPRHIGQGIEAANVSDPRAGHPARDDRGAAPVAVEGADDVPGAKDFGGSALTEVSPQEARIEEKHVAPREETGVAVRGEADAPPKVEAPVRHKSSQPSKPPEVITNSIGMKLALLPAGDFLMGSPDSDPKAESDEKPQHRTRITRPFCLGIYETTQEEYQRVMGMNPSGEQISPRHPVEMVSWFDAMRFCNRLSEMEDLDPYCKISGEEVIILGGNGYRLATEAEWEYACRAGGTTLWSFGDDLQELGKYAWCKGNAGNNSHPVGQKEPNPFGLYDMHGHLWEWCWDWYEEDYYKHSPVDDPQGPGAGYLRVERGGDGWNYDPPYLRSAYRNHLKPTDRFINLGFRVARTSSPVPRRASSPVPQRTPSPSPHRTSSFAPQGRVREVIPARTGSSLDLRETQITLRKGPFRFQATVIAKDDSTLTILTAAHCLAAPDGVMQVQMSAMIDRDNEGNALFGRIVEVVQNPLFEESGMNASARGSDSAVATIEVALTNGNEREAFMRMKPAELAEWSYERTSNLILDVRIFDQFGKEHLVHAGNHTNPRFLVWGNRAYQPISGDSGSGVFLFRKIPAGQSSPILIGNVAMQDEAGGVAPLIGRNSSWITFENGRVRRAHAGVK